MESSLDAVDAAVAFRRRCTESVCSWDYVRLRSLWILPLQDQEERGVEEGPGGLLEDSREIAGHGGGPALGGEEKGSCGPVFCAVA